MTRELMFLRNQKPRYPQELRQELRQWIGLHQPVDPVDWQCHATEEFADYQSKLVSYCGADGDRIPAYLLVPHDVRTPAPAVLVHHQHNGERHLGKSEVCGLAGDPLQAIGPVLAARGLIVLAPDSVCFEDRRAVGKGTVAHPDDWLQHYNEMCYRLVQGDTLMRKVLTDAELGLSALWALPEVDRRHIGVLGHSYGGNTSLFQGALDTRVGFCCTSGAVCSYREKIRTGTAIEMAEVLPSAMMRFEVDDLLRLIAPRPVLIVSATADKYSSDADAMVDNARTAFAANPEALKHLRYEGNHPLTSDRVKEIVAWVAETSKS